MHNSALSWIKHVTERQNIADRRVLEVGARDVNGTPRQLFRGHYVGLDMIAGNGVDIVANANAIPLPDADFDVVISAEMLEHDLCFWKTLREIKRVLRPSGVWIITCRGIGFAYHAWPDDYWRFTPIGLAACLSELGLLPAEIISDPEFSGVLAWGRK